MENDYIKLPDNKTPEIIEVRPIEKNVPKRITVIYELATPKDKNISKEDDKVDNKDLSR
ncbi:MAG: hypothetical protein RL596_2045 [Bacteroidota bacterium]|jgi:hypothetical protein